MKLREELQNTIRKIKSRKLQRNFSEEATKHSLILPVLSALGWDTSDPDEIIPEFEDGGGRRVDYALHIENEMRVLIEVKKYGEDLTGHQEQLCNYAFRKGVEQAILTNGASWWFYLPLEKSDWTDRKILWVDLEEQEEGLVLDRLIELLVKDNVSNRNSIKTSKAYLSHRRKEAEIAKAIPHVWNEMISESDIDLINLISDHVERKCGYRPEPENVVTFLKQNTSGAGETFRSTPTRTKSTKVQSHRKPIEKVSKSINAAKKWDAIKFFGKKYNVKNQADAMLIIGKVLHERDKEKFEKIAPGLGTEHRPWYTKKLTEKRYYLRIPDTSWYVLVHMSSNDKRRRISEILKAFGVSEKSLEIIGE